MEIEKYKVDRDGLKHILRSKSSRTIDYKQPKIAVEIQGFDKVPGRQKPSPFLLHNVKDTHAKIDYDNKKDVVLVKSARPVFTKEKDERLSALMKRPIYKDQAAEDQCCGKLELTNNQHIRTASDLQAHRRTSHSISFQKQTSRPFDETLRKMSINVEKQHLSRSNSLGGLSQAAYNPPDPLEKLNKVHSFASYTQRDFLSYKKVRGAP